MWQGLDSGWKQKAEQLQVEKKDLLFQVEAVEEANRRLVAQLQAYERQLEPLPVVDDREPSTEFHAPSAAYLAGKMPTYNIPDLIEHLKERAGIHLSYLNLLKTEPGKWESYGTEKDHWWAIEGYENAIWYLRRLI